MLFFILAHVWFMQAMSQVSDREGPVWAVGLLVVVATAVVVPCMVAVVDE